MMWIKFGALIWPHRLQDYNVLVLEKDAKNFPSNTLGGKIEFLNLLKWKTLNYKVLQNQHINTLVQENIIPLTLCICKMALKCQNIAKKKLQEMASLSLKLPSTKMLWSITHNLLYWYKILTTQTTLVYATFTKNIIGNKYNKQRNQPLPAQVYHAIIQNV